MATENASIASGRADPGPAILRRGLESLLRHHHCHVKKPPGTPVSGAFCAPRRRGHPSPGGRGLAVPLVARGRLRRRRPPIPMTVRVNFRRRTETVCAGPAPTVHRLCRQITGGGRWQGRGAGRRQANREGRRANFFSGLRRGEG